MGRSKDDITWRKIFGQILKVIFSIYDLTYDDFAAHYQWSSSTVRYWVIGRNLPSRTALKKLKEFLLQNIPDDTKQSQQLYEQIKIIFKAAGAFDIYLLLQRTYPQPNQFASEVLSTCFNNAKHNSFITQSPTHELPSKGTTQIVVFDFDGTLTSGIITKTTQEALWTGLGYDIGLCKQFHQQYDQHKISHEEWCKITEANFRARKLNKTSVNEIASNICLIQGIKDTFNELSKRNIKIFIVSGSIKTIISAALSNLCEYVEQISANEFCFDSNGYLTKIIGTKYDFEGKAAFISKIASKYEISEHNILFVGNSINDRFAYMSGARTLCINPRLTDPTNCTVWNYCIPFCEDLTDILQFI